MPKSKSRFSRSHYVAVAALLGNRYRIANEMRHDSETLAAIRLIAADFINLFSADSSSFDAQKFAAAFKAEGKI